MGVYTNTTRQEEQLEALFKAIEADDIPAAQRVLDQGLDVNARSEYPNWRETPMHRAVKCGYPAISEFLWSKGANLNAKDGGGFTPLDHTHSLKMYALLKPKGAKRTASEDNGIGGDKGMFSRANTTKALIDLCHLRLTGGKKTLIFERRRKEERIVAQNLASGRIGLGADLDAVDEEGLTPLAIVTRSPHEQNYLPGGRDDSFQEMLVKSGANLHAVDKDGNTPLHYVAQYSDMKQNPEYPDYNANRDGPMLAKFFVERGADPHAKNKEGKSPLDIAREAKSVNIIAAMEEAEKTRLSPVFATIQHTPPENVPQNPAIPSVASTPEVKQQPAQPAKPGTHAKHATDKADTLNIFAPLAAFAGILGLGMLSGGGVGLGTVIAAIVATLAVAVGTQYYTQTGAFDPAADRMKNAPSQGNGKAPAAEKPAPAQPSADKHTSLDAGMQRALDQHRSGYRPADAAPADAQVSAPVVPRRAPDDSGKTFLS